VKIRPVSVVEGQALGDAIVPALAESITRTVATVTRHWREVGQASVDDLAAITPAWAREVTERLMPHLADAFWAGVNGVHAPLTQALTAALPPAELPDEWQDPAVVEGAPLEEAGAAAIAKVTNEQALHYLSEANNRLVAVSNLIWELARGELLDGMAAGEGVEKLAARVARVSPQLAQPRAEVIARTETLGAANAGSFAQIQATGMTGTKKWLAASDSRVRPSHSRASGQEVAINDTFSVGAAAMLRPHDPNAPASETVNCRCVLTYSVDAQQELPGMAGAIVTLDEPLTAQADDGEEQTGAMIALVPADPGKLALDGGEAADDLHLTLLYLGEAAEWSEAQRQALADNVARLFRGYGEVDAAAFGVNLWNPGSDTPAWVLAVGDGPEQAGYLGEAHELAEQAISPDLDELVPAQHTPWAAHVCVAYSTDPAVLPAAVEKLGPVSFDRVRVAFAGSVTDTPLGG